MDIEKIRYTIGCIKSVYGLSDDSANLLVVNVTERIKLYQETHKYIDAKRDSNQMYAFEPKDDKYTLTDFFLNRLLFNIREYDMNGDLLIRKGGFTPVLKTFEIAKSLDLKEETANVLKPYTEDKTVINKSSVKVFNHEVGHALQTRYSAGKEIPSLDKSSEKNKNYIRVIELLKCKYSNINIKIDSDYSEYITGGLRYADGTLEDKDKYYCKKYQPNNVLDEIMNEEEALCITGCDTIQRQKQYGGDGDYRNIYNYESSNCYITCYAKMIKSLIGPKVFDYMYLNSDGLIKDFEHYRDLVNNTIVNIPDNMPALVGVINRLEKIKELKNENEECRKICMNLDLFFAKCIERFINDRISNIDKISDKAYNLAISHIDEIQNAMLTNDDINKRNELPQHKILNELRIKLKEYNDNYKLEQKIDNRKRTL